MVTHVSVLGSLVKLDSVVTRLAYEANTCGQHDGTYAQFYRRRKSMGHTCNGLAQVCHNSFIYLG